MNKLEISARERLISRICFYVLVYAVFWGANFMLPDYDRIEREHYARLGVIEPIIGVPVSELPPEIRARIPTGR